MLWPLGDKAPAQRRADASVPKGQARDQGGEFTTPAQASRCFSARTDRLSGRPLDLMTDSPAIEHAPERQDQRLQVLFEVADAVIGGMHDLADLQTPGAVVIDRHLGIQRLPTEIPCC